MVLCFGGGGGKAKVHADDRSIQSMSSDPNERVVAKENAQVGSELKIDAMDSNASNKPTRQRVAGTSTTPTANKKITLQTQKTPH